MKIHTSLDAGRNAALQHGTHLANMDDWELCCALDAPIPTGCSAEHTKTTHDSDRPIIQHLIRKGYSNSAIARELNDQSRYGPRGGTWTATSVRRWRTRYGL